jgi:hypothetical protein
VALVHLGVIVEIASSTALFRHLPHHYTRACHPRFRCPTPTRNQRAGCEHHMKTGAAVAAFARPV